MAEPTFLLENGPFNKENTNHIPICCDLESSLLSRFEDGGGIHKKCLVRGNES